MVFLFDEFFIPRRIAAATVQGLRRQKANEGDLASMKTLNSKAKGVDLIDEGHRFDGPNNSHCVAVVAPMINMGCAGSSAWLSVVTSKALCRMLLSCFLEQTSGQQASTQRAPELPC